MTIKIVFFSTSSFPFPPGEQFIESEICYWSNLPNTKVVLIPSLTAGTPRFVPEDIDVFKRDRYFKSLKKILFIFKAIFSPLFFNEVIWLIFNNLLLMGNIKSALREVAITLRERTLLQSALRKYGRADLIYCYWNATSAYAACLLKRNGKVGSVISRAHGSDLYEERRRNSYMPLKRQFIYDFKKIYSISEKGKKYLKEKYGFGDKTLKVSRLGVRLPEKAALPSADGILRVCSVSFCVPVKRIDKIIESLALLSKNYPERKLEWTHFGDGPLKMDLENSAQKTLTSLPNVSYKFMGMVSNLGILNYYENSPVDVFINTSESEGVPVSIMEAMSYGIPSVAPSVGGISELITDECGRLLDIDFELNDIVNAIIELSKEENYRCRINARQKIVESYNSEKNYKEFVGDIVSNIKK